MIEREKVIAILSNIIEPELKKDIVTLNLVEDLRIESKEIHLTVYVSNPAMHARNRMKEAVVFNLKSRLGESVKINCQVKQKANDLNDAHRKVLPSVKKIISICM